MGWIYNGTEVVKANKAQQKAYDDFKRHELVVSGLAQPFTIPTLAVLSGVFLGGLTVAGFTAVLWGPVTELVKEKEKQIKEYVTLDFEEKQTFYVDFQNCSNTVEKSNIPGVTNLRIVACLKKKGWTDQIIIQGLRGALGI